MTLERTYHNVYDAHYHLVFPVKYRKALLTNEIPRAISQIAEEIGQRYDIDFERIGYDLLTSINFLKFRPVPLVI